MSSWKTFQKQSAKCKPTQYIKIEVTLACGHKTMVGVAKDHAAERKQWFATNGRCRDCERSV